VGPLDAGTAFRAQLRHVTDEKVKRNVDNLETMTQTHVLITQQIFILQQDNNKIYVLTTIRSRLKSSMLD